MKIDEGQKEWQPSNGEFDSCPVKSSITKGFIRGDGTEANPFERVFFRSFQISTGTEVTGYYRMEDSTFIQDIVYCALKNFLKRLQECKASLKVVQKIRKFFFNVFKAFK